MIYDTDTINALVYGNWDFESVINPAMWQNVMYLTKSEYKKGLRPFK